MINNWLQNNRIGFFVLFLMPILFIMMACNANAESDEYCLTSWVGTRTPQNSIVGFVEDPYDELTDFQSFKWLFSSEMNFVKAYFAEGTAVFVDNSKRIENDNDFVEVVLPGSSRTPVRIDKKYLIPSKEYNKMYDPPKMIIQYREAMFESPYSSNHQIVTVLDPGNEVEVIAVIGNQFLIYYNGEYGYIRQDGGSFKNDGYTYAGNPDSKRQYDLALLYYEPLFQPADISLIDNLSQYVDEATAIDYAMAYLEKNIDIEQLQFEGYSLSTYARLNSAHLNSPIGLTWQIILYGNQREELLGSSAIFVDCDNLDNTIIVLPNDLKSDVFLPSSLLLMTEEDWIGVRSELGDDIQARFVYCIIEVSVNTGDIIILDVLLDTPYGRTALYK